MPRLCGRRPGRLASLCGVAHLRPVHDQSYEMLNQSNVEKLATTLAEARGVTAALMAEVVAASPRLTTLRAQGKTDRLDHLAAANAWSDAALELLALEAPEWAVQRLCRDDGEWLCTLTRFPELPDWLDDCAEARHPVLAVAILSALLDLRARPADARRSWAAQPADARAVDCADYR